MPKLTPAQNQVYHKSQKNSDIYFRRNLKTGKEQCFIGSVRINPRVWFFFYSMGYFSLQSKSEGKKWDYYYMCLKHYKLDEYLEENARKF
jgi:hypothetical protein